MSWLGKLLGGGIGFVIGGPFGAILGAVVGHHALDTGAGSSMSSQEQRQTLFFVAVFSMLGKLAKADGVVSKKEIEVVEGFMRNNLRLDADAREFAIGIFKQARDSTDRFEDFAQQFYQEFADSPAALTSLLDLLLMVAQADGAMHDEEARLIESAARIFGIEGEFRQFSARHSGLKNLDRCYQLLGASKSETLASIKKKYRKLAMELHPDRVQARGVSPEFAEEAEARFKDIQHAWDQVEKHHKA